VQKGGVANGANFATTEKATDWYGPQVFVEQLRVKVRGLIEGFPPPHAGKHQCSQGRHQILGRLVLIALEQGFEIVGRGAGIPQVKLHPLAGADAIANGNGPKFRIDPQQCANQEIAMV
jgi:hypothetical protein